MLIFDFFKLFCSSRKVLCLFPSFFIALFLISCSGNVNLKESEIKGKRLSVISAGNKLIISPSLQTEEVKLPSPFLNKNWPQDGGSPNNAMHHLEISEVPKLVWRVTIGKKNSKNIRLIANPIVAENNVYVIDGESFLSSLNLISGKSNWRVRLAPKKEKLGVLGGGLGFHKNVIIAITGYGDVFAIKSEDGSVVWKKELKVPLRGAPTIADGKIFVLSVDNKIFAINFDNGEFIWKHENLTESLSILGAGSPAYKDGIIIVPYSSGDIVALSAGYGDIIWSDNLVLGNAKLNLSQLDDANSRPVIDKEIVYAVGLGGKMIAVNLQTGKRIWSKAIGGKGSPWIGGNFLFLITHQNELLAISKVNGMIRWITQLPLYANSKKQNLKILWNSPVLASNRLLTVSSNGYIKSISPYSGKVLGQVKISSGTFIESVLAEGHFIVLTNDGKLSAYR